jgi:hypothetical protein
LSKRALSHQAGEMNRDGNNNKDDQFLHIYLNKALIPHVISKRNDIAEQKGSKKKNSFAIIKKLSPSL